MSEEQTDLKSSEQQLAELLANADGGNYETLFSRQWWVDRLGKTHDGMRNLYEVFGYKTEFCYGDFLNKYFRQDIAHRIIRSYPEAIWPAKPHVQEDEEVENETMFEQQFRQLALRLKLYHYMQRLDILVGLGEYAVLFIGVRDGQMDLRKPIGRLNSSDDVLFLMPFSQKCAEIVTYDENIHSERFGQPDIYRLETGGYNGMVAKQHTNQSRQMRNKKFEVHHSRLIHVSEGLLDNDIFGVPRLLPIMNRLDDLEKVAGGSSELFWLNGRGGLSLEADKAAPERDTKKLKEKTAEFVNKLSRFLLLKGITAKPLEFKVDSPAEHVSVQLDLISSACGIPKRILLGSERGEMASTQDERNWNARVIERRENFCDPMMLRPLIDKLMEIGALPMAMEYDVKWSNTMPLSEKDRADVATQIAAAIASYINSDGGTLLLTPEQFVTQVLGYDYRAKDIEALEQKEKEEMEAEMKMMQEMNPPKPDESKGAAQ